MPQTITRRNVLAAIKAAPHAICVNEMKEKLGYPRTSDSTLFNEIVAGMKNEGLIKEHRRVRGNYFTNPDKRREVEAILNPAPARTTAPSTGSTTASGFTPFDIKVLGIIRRAPHAVSLDGIKSGLSSQGERDAVNNAVGKLYNSGLLVGHADKYGFFYTKKEKRAEIDQMLADASRTATASLSPSEEGVLALLRLSDHGSSIQGIRGAMESLKVKGFIREDKRDANLPADQKRWFTRRGKRGEADAMIGNRINNGDTEIAERGGF